MPEDPCTFDNKGEETAILAELDSFSKLEKGWNSYSAPSPTTLAIENAKVLVTIGYSNNTFPERVEPSAMGGVGVTFSAGDREVVVELYNNGTAHAFFSDNVTQKMETRPVSTNVNSYRVFRDEVHTYLYALERTEATPRSNLS